MKNLTIACICLVVLAACHKQETAKTAHYVDPDHTTSFIRLLANADFFDGKEVQVSGFFRQGIEESAIYPSRDLSLDPANGLWVDLPSDKAGKFRTEGSWVMLQGTFQAQAHGHLGRFSGTLGNISKTRIRDSQYEILVLGKNPANLPTPR